MSRGLTEAFGLWLFHRARKASSVFLYFCRFKSLSRQWPRFKPRSPGCICYLMTESIEPRCSATTAYSLNSAENVRNWWHFKLGTLSSVLNAMLYLQSFHPNFRGLKGTITLVMFLLECLCFLFSFWWSILSSRRRSLKTAHLFAQIILSTVASNA